MAPRTRLAGTLDPTRVEHSRVSSRGTVPVANVVQTENAATAIAARDVAISARDGALDSEEAAAASAAAADVSEATAVASATAASASAIAAATSATASDAARIASETARDLAVAAVAGDLEAADISFIPTDTISATNVKAALEELSAEKAPKADPTFTGTVAGISKGMVGLGNVDNTADTAKPVSTAQQTALNLKANIASPTFTGTVAGITKTMVGLGSVDNTADTAKPVSTAQQTALDLKAPLTGAAFVDRPTFAGSVPWDNANLTVSTFAKSYLDEATAAATRAVLRQGARTLQVGFAGLTGVGTTNNTTAYAVAAAVENVNVTPTEADSILEYTFICRIRGYIGTNASGDIGVNIQVKYYDGSAYQSMGYSINPLILTTGLAITQMDWNGSIQGQVSVARRRSDTGNWTIRPYMSAAQTGNNVELDLMSIIWAELSPTRDWV